jgi:hypothetical protein
MEKLHWIFMEYQWDIDKVIGYPLVNCPKKLWKDPPFLMGKLTMSMAIFNSYVSLPEGNTDGVNMAQEILNSACFFHWKIDSTMGDVSNRD